MTDNERELLLILQDYDLDDPRELSKLFKLLIALDEYEYYNSARAGMLPQSVIALHSFWFGLET